ncbi:MAG: pirin family protein [Candidatus Bathyarchaeia archaeon]
MRQPDTIHIPQGRIENGSFRGRWHFSFDEYYDELFVQFGTLRVLNDDTLSPGAVWPLHPHTRNEVVTYVVEGEFRHADQNGKGGVLKKGWVQHTTIGRGMWHSEINNLPDKPMRFIQMWFIPWDPNAEPSVEQMPVEKEQRTNKWLPLVFSHVSSALKIKSDAEVHSCFLQANKTVLHKVKPGWGCYLYVLEGKTVELNGKTLPVLGAAMVRNENELIVTAKGEAELLLVSVIL